MQANGQGLEAEQLLLDEYEACSDKTGTYALSSFAITWLYLSQYLPA